MLLHVTMPLGLINLSRDVENSLLVNLKKETISLDLVRNIDKLASKQNR